MMAVVVETRSPKFYVAIQTQNATYTTDTSAIQLRDSIYEISTSRHIGDNAGAFQITMSPRIKDVSKQTNWFDLLSPMDYVEIAIDSGVQDPDEERHPVAGRGARPAPVMRGFIDNIVEQGSFESGTPSRSIVITGRDFGKIALFTLMYNYSETKIPPTVQVLQRLGEGRATLSGQSITPDPVSSTALDKLTSDAGRNPRGMMSLFFFYFFEPHMSEITSTLKATPQIGGSRARIATIEYFLDPYNDDLICFDPIIENQDIDPWSPVWNSFGNYMNKPWSELYFDDDDNGPRMIYRTAPWFDVNGAIVQGTPAFTAIIDERRVLTYMYGKSDTEVVNLFATQSLLWGPLVKARLNMGDIGDEVGKNPRINDIKNTPSNIFRFGLRPGSLNSPYLNVRSGIDQDTYEKNVERPDGPGTKLNDLYYRAWSFSEQLLVGQITIKGTTRIHIGDYIALKLVNRPLMHFYVEGVTHTFRQPTGIEGGEGSFITSLIITRGQVEKLGPIA